MSRAVARAVPHSRLLFLPKERNMLLNKLRIAANLVALLLLIGGTGLGECQSEAQTKESKVRLDLYGDALPAGAVARLGTLRFRHADVIAFAAFLPGGKSVVTVGDDGIICVW